MHARLFPSPAAIAGLMLETLRTNNYPGFWRPTKGYTTRQQFKDGININSRISEIKYQVCSKGSNRSYRNTALSKFTARDFQQKKVSMTIVWDISTTDGQTLGSFRSKVHENQWQKDKGHLKVFSRAFDQALSQLFSQKEFIALLHDGYRKPQVDRKDTDTSTADDSSLMDKSTSLYQTLRDKLVTYAGLSKQAQLSELLVIFQQIKVSTTQYYLSEGIWPESLQQVGLSSQDYVNNSDILGNIYTGADGTITMELSDALGQNAVMEFRPNTSKNTMISWQCASNMDRESIPPALKCGPLY